jgi:Cof subfamily protein (haloacid dehalogenase superfamily)
VPRYDLLAIDLDGTLLDSEGRLSPRNRGALHRAHAAGMKIVLCTGRSYTETRPVLAEIGLDLDASVTVGGALVSEVATGCTLYRSEIVTETAVQAAGWLRDRGYAVIWLLDADQAGFDGYICAGPRRHPAIDRWLSISPVTMREHAALPSELPLRLTVLDDDPHLPGLSADLDKAFNGRLVHNVLPVRWGFTVIEAFAAGVSKWSGIVRLCDRWGLDPARSVAIGDHVNDLAMIREAGLGVAVGNGEACVRAAAARVVAENDRDGVADLIDELLT